MKIFVLNCGSSSLKYQVIDMANEQVLAKGLCERIGIEGSVLTHQPEGKDKVVQEEAMPDHVKAIQMVIDALLDANHGVIKDISEINAVGHRVVHGGEFFAVSTLVNADVKEKLEQCIPLAPLHNPANIMGIDACEKLMKDTPQACVFDTAFHQTMPKEAFLYGLPYEIYEKYKVRRYGFHGTSHRYVSDRAASIIGKPIEELKLISVHLGNGASVCAIDGGKSIDTSMGFTPLEGLVMGTRSGDIDGAITTYLMKEMNISAEEVETIYNKKSGVLGLSEVSSDFRDLETADKEGNEKANTALKVFHYKVAKYIGSYVAAMNGVDAIIFTAGIGENGANTRAEICEYLGYLGLTVDKEKNSNRGKEIEISKDGSTTKAFIIPTNEELVIARDTKELLGK